MGEGLGRIVARCNEVEVHVTPWLVHGLIVMRAEIVVSAGYEPVHGIRGAVRSADHGHLLDTTARGRTCETGTDPTVQNKLGQGFESSNIRSAIAQYKVSVLTHTEFLPRRGLQVLQDCQKRQVLYIHVKYCIFSGQQLTCARPRHSVASQNSSMATITVEHC